MLESITLGFIQGVTEWLPISSSGITTWVNVVIFGGHFKQTISVVVFLHLGTFFAALFYFRKDVRRIFLANSEEYKKILLFLIISTAVTGIVGFLVLKVFLGIAFLNLSIKSALGLIGAFLIITGILQFKKPEEGFKEAGKLTVFDGVLLGIVQGFSALPGLSRSGLTIAGFLFRGYKDTEALRLSFLMSLPAVLGANILFNLPKLGLGHNIFNFNSLIGLVVSFVIGLVTIHGFITLSRKINFGYFAILFGVLTLIGVLI